MNLNDLGVICLRVPRILTALACMDSDIVKSLVISLCVVLHILSEMSFIRDYAAPDSMTPMVSVSKLLKTEIFPNVLGRIILDKLSPLYVILTSTQSNW